MRRLFVSAALAALAAAPALAQPLPPYPAARRAAVVDTLHGVAVADPYRWLEDAQSAETRAFVEAQAAYARRTLDALPERAAFRERLDAVFAYPRVGTPTRRTRWTFVSRNPGLANQSTVYVRPTSGGPGASSRERVLVDPNTLSSDGTVGLAGMSPSKTGDYVAMQFSNGGSDWRTVRVRHVPSGRDLPETLTRVKFSGAAWKPDGTGFYYNRYDTPTGRDSLQAANQNPKVYFHRLGTPQTSDILVYERPDRPTWQLGAGVSDDGRWLFVSASEGTSPNNHLFARRLDVGGSPWQTVFTGDATYSVVDTDGDDLIVRTNRGAPTSRLVRVSALRPSEMRDVIPASSAVLQSVVRAGDFYVASALDDVKSRLTIHALDGRLVRTVELPGIGSVGGISGGRDFGDVYYSFSSYDRPPTIVRSDLATGRATVVDAPRVAFRPADFVVSQRFVTGKDGARVPLFLVHRRGLALDGTNPTLLYGYGGFNVSLTPGFSASLIPWIERGGVYAVVNLRGGGEYGQAWHDAGRLANKQTVFDDAIAAAEYLVRERITSPAHLAIQGGSNGGLLVGAVVNQRPDLFAAAVPQVGVMDMLRFDRFTIGRAWTSDYGSPSDPAMFPVLYGYSPLHNLRAGTRYPATLVTTADFDDRVVPAHSYKYGAALQAAQVAGGPPVLLRIETRSGHGASNTTKALDQSADIYAFLWHHLGR